jgi:hypothetical protein
MSHFTCLEVRELAPELALGLVSGADRAHALTHLASCTECRMLVEGLSRTADTLLLLAPEAEPPIGFESRAMSRATGGRRRIPRRWVAAVAAAAVLSSAITGIAMYAAGGQTRSLARQYERVVTAIGGKTLRAAVLRSIDGRVVGKVYAYQGKPSWLFLVVTDRDGTGEYQIELDPITGESIRLAKLRIQAGQGSWASTAAIDIDQLQSVRVIDQTGVAEYEANFNRK